MYFGVDEDVIVEYDSLEMHEEYVRDFVEHVSLSGVRTIATGFAEAVCYELTCVHALEG